MRRLAADGLIDEGMTVTEAVSSADGHRALSGPHAIDLLVVDLDLDGGSGVSFADDARSIYPDLPVLFLTDTEIPLENLESYISNEGFDRPFGVMRIRLDGASIEQRHTGTVDGRGHI